MDIKMFTPNTLGEALKKQREESGKTLQEVAVSAGISISYLSDIECGRTIPTLKTLQAIIEKGYSGHQLIIAWMESGEEFFPANRAEIEMLYALRAGNLPRVLLMLTAMVLEREGE